MTLTPENNSARAELFEALVQVHSGEILNRGVRVRCTAGETLFLQGDPAARCFLVVEGRLKLVKLHEQGRETIIRYVGPGELCAVIAVYREKEYPVTALAVTESELVGWDKKTMRALLLEFPTLALKVLEVAVDRLDELQNRYMELCAEQVEQRVARALLRFMEQAGRRTEQGIVIDFRLSRQELADYIGTTLFTVSRHLSVWEKRGWIKSSRESIVVVDPHALVVLTEKSASDPF